MPLIVTTTSSLVCDLCHHETTTFTAGTDSPDFRQWVTARSWVLVDADEPGTPATVIGPLCAATVRPLGTNPAVDDALRAAQKRRPPDNVVQLHAY